MTYRPILPADLQPEAAALLHTLDVRSDSAGDANSHGTDSGGNAVCFLPCLLHAVRRSAIAGTSGDPRILALCIGSAHWVYTFAKNEITHRQEGLAANVEVAAKTFNLCRAKLSTYG